MPAGARKKKKGYKPPARHSPAPAAASWRAPAHWENLFLKRKPLFYAGFFFAALAIRIAYVLSLQHLPTFDEPVLDGDYHHRVAEIILQSGPLADGEERYKPFYRSPFYMYVLALIYKLFGAGFLMPRLFGALCGAVSVVLVMRVGERVFGARAALFSGVIALLCWPMIYFDGELLTTSLTMMMGLILLLLFMRALEEQTWLNFCVFGLFFGLMAVTRENYFPIIGLCFLFLIVYLRRAALPLLFFASALLAISPVTLRNYLVLDDFVPITHYTGVNLYIGNNPYADGRTAIVPFTTASWWGGVADVERLTEEAYGRPVKPSEISVHWTKKTLEYIGDDFGHFFGNVLKKFVFIFDLRERSNNKEIYFFRDQSAVLGFPLFALFSGYLYIPLGLLGLALSLLSRNKKALPIYVIFAGYVIGLSLGFLNSRIRMPVIVMLIIFAGYALTRLFAAGERRLLPARIGATAAAVTLIAAVNAPPPGHEYRANLAGHFIMGNAYMRRDNLDEAEAHFFESIKLTLGEYRARSLNALSEIELRRGIAAVREEDKAGAVKHFYRALDHQDNFAAHVNLANLLSGEEGGEALSHYQRALEMEPDNPYPLLGLANYYLNRGEAQQARDYYAQLRVRAALAGDALPPAFIQQIKTLEEKMNAAPPAAPAAADNAAEDS